MKHSWKITSVLLVMFLVTQLIGLAVIYSYTIVPELPYGMQPPELETSFDLWQAFVSLIIAFAIAVLLMFLLSKFKVALILRIWFFVVVVIAIGITVNSILYYFPIPYASLIAALFALPLAFYKIFKQNLIIHNITELMIYPGIAAVFVSFLFFPANPSLSILIMIFILLGISAYDIYAVWHAGFMQKMAKFQINELKFFAGFFVPYLGKKQRQQLKNLRQKYKKRESFEKALKKKKMKVSLAILGGGDVVFPIIATGIFMKTFGLVPALMVTIFSTIALGALFIAARKGKFYPAMPFITSGIFVGMILGWLIHLV